MKSIGYLTFAAYTTQVCYDYASKKLYVKYDLIRMYECNVSMAAQILSGDKDMLDLITSSQVGVIVSKLPSGLIWVDMPEQMVEMYSVDSSNVSAVGYDADSKILYVEYGGGDVYAYANVPFSYWTALQNADSKGSWIHWFIKINDSEYPYTKVSSANLHYGGKTTPNAGKAHPEGYMTGFNNEQIKR